MKTLSLQQFYTIKSLAELSFKSRNEGSVLGIFWYLLNPVLMFSLLLIIFSTRLGEDINQYPLYLLLGIIIFNFFRQTTIEATKALESNRFIVKNTMIPVWILVGVSIYRITLSHFFEIIAFGVVLLVFKVPLYLILIYIPIVILLALFSFGVSLIFITINAYIADLENIWLFGSQILWFITPIFYAIEGQTTLFYLNLINPMYYFIDLARTSIIYGQIPSLTIILGSILFTIISVATGILCYMTLKKRIPEMV